jgi:hypothetical protein
MLFNLGLFHKREAKPAQWAVFDSVGKDEDDLIDDLVPPIAGDGVVIQGWDEHPGSDADPSDGGGAVCA